MSLKKNTTGSTISKAAFSLLISVGIMAALCALMTVISFCTKDPMSLVKPLSIAAVILGAAVSSLISSRKFSKSASVISSLIFTLIMMSVGIVAGGGKMNTGALINYACYMAVALLFSFLPSNKAKHRRHR